jgi:hypothetical protein
LKSVLIVAAHAMLERMPGEYQQLVENWSFRDLIGVGQRRNAPKEIIIK